MALPTTEETIATVPLFAGHEIEWFANGDDGLTLRACIYPREAFSPSSEYGVAWHRSGRRSCIWQGGDAKGRPLRARDFAALKPLAKAAIVALFANRRELPDEIFVRWNLPPRRGRSRNYLTGDLEAGVSCYRARYNETTRLIELDDDDPVDIRTALGYIPLRLPCYLITGREVGRGGDNEPLLRRVKILGDLRYDTTRGGFAFDQQDSDGE